ncbi:hypothetical protein IMSHALPRED_010214 [Imshaugia aleurites]|uniref:Uncharacterized protein n=1 Tax=Imshaugia aleurites TaxID=172621 RepID=A0A8H3G5Y9_9LECA|nr:hypothetical protein IMSHALPRED_010214 [Imshaugia aleurites]
MCQTFYLEHDTCTCLYIPNRFSPCGAQRIAHGFCETPADPEDPFADPVDPFAEPIPKPYIGGAAFRPKLLARAYRGLNFTYEGVDYLSTDVCDLLEPEGMVCPEGGLTNRRIYRAEGAYKGCVLCDKPDVLQISREIQNWEYRERMGEGEEKKKEKEKEKEKKSEKEKTKSIFHKTAQIGTAAVKSFKSAIGGKAKTAEDGSAIDKTVEVKTVEKKESSADKGAGNEEKPKKVRKSMYLDQWGDPIPLFC